MKSRIRFERLAKWSGVPRATIRSHRLYTFLPAKGARTAHKAAIAFASGNAAHWFLTFIGEAGRGKSHLAIGIGWHWLENDIGLMKYYQVESLLDELRRGYDAKPGQALYSFDQLMKWIKEVSLLILDDLGVEQSTPWARAKLDEIIDHRYVNEMPTVFTTNLTVDELQSRVSSRLSEGEVIILTGIDFRGHKADERRKTEAAKKKSA